MEDFVLPLNRAAIIDFAGEKQQVQIMHSANVRRSLTLEPQEAEKEQQMGTDRRNYAKWSKTNRRLSWSFSEK